MSPETNPSGGKFIGIVLSPSELVIFATLARSDQKAIINNRFEQLDAIVEKAKHVRAKEEKELPQKPGEPDWEKVIQDAQKAFGEKMSDPSIAPYYRES